MKSIILLGLLIGAQSVNAVVTKSCPETIEIALNNYDLNGVVDDNFEPQDPNDFPYDGWNGQGILALRKKLSKEGELVASLELKWKGQAKCEYRGETALGKYASARLEGSLRGGAKEPATMVLYTGSLVVYVDLADIQKSGIVAKYDLVPLYYAGEYCSWGDCIPDHIQIGDSSLKYLK